MLVQLLVSLFGIAFVHRNLSLVEKIEVVSSEKLNLFFYFLQLPFCFYLFFKELLPFISIYIGIFLITLILFEKIIGYFREITFEKLHLYIIERMILHLKAGKSAQTSTKIVFDNLTGWQKATFSKIREVFEIKTRISYENRQLQGFQLFYFMELEIILRSSCGVIEQLKAFRAALRTYNNLRHKSRQATQQPKAQAIVSVFLYSVFIVIGKKYLNLELISLTMLISMVLFCLGIIIIFKIGGKIRWKT